MTRITDLNAYQENAKVTAVFKTDGLTYCALGLTGEAGEYADKVKKTLRGDTSRDEPEVKKALALELGDVLWYLAISALQLGYTLEDVANMNAEKLASRRARNVVRGSGDNR